MKSVANVEPAELFLLQNECVQNSDHQSAGAQQRTGNGPDSSPVLTCALLARTVAGLPSCPWMMGMHSCIALSRLAHSACRLAFSQQHRHIQQTQLKPPDQQTQAGQVQRRLKLA